MNKVHICSVKLTGYVSVILVHKWPVQGFRWPKIFGRRPGDLERGF